MKKLKYQILFAILFMTIGIAAVTTNLVLNGTTSLASNPDDFDVYFTSVHQPSGTSEARIDVHSKTNFSFLADLSDLGDFVNISFSVYNSSRIYDAAVELNCDFDSEYINLAYELENDTIPATTTVDGLVVVSLKKSYSGQNELDVNISCSIDANAIERDSASDAPLIPSVELTYNIGQEVAIGNEKFNIISDNGDGTVSMLAQYNLGTDYRQTENKVHFEFSDSFGWDDSAPVDIQQYDGNAKTYVNQYVSYLKKELGDSTLSGDLITLFELDELGCLVTGDFINFGDYRCIDSPYASWLINGQGWWTRSAASFDGLYALTSVGLIGSNFFDDESPESIDSLGIRPIITVSKESLEKVIIEFTIDGTTYKATEGMTWGEWVDSEYNTSDFILDDVYVVNSRYYKISCNGLVISSNDYINSGSSYKFTSGYQSQ